MPAARVTSRIFDNELHQEDAVPEKTKVQSKSQLKNQKKKLRKWKKQAAGVFSKGRRV